MKYAKTALAALAAAALALTLLAGCSSVLAGGTVKQDTAKAEALMQQLGTGLTYSTALEETASRLADWLVEDPNQLSTQSGLFVRKVALTADSGNMTDTNARDFIDHSSMQSSIWVAIPADVTVGLALDNQSRAFTGYLYAPAAAGAAQRLGSYAAGSSRMGAVFIEYGGETYVVALFA